jgi:NitT/TauT family transport system substrate-binding protein
MQPKRCLLALVASLTLAGLAPAGAVDKITVAVNKLSAGSPLYIGRAKGYFAAESLEVELLHSTSAQTIGLAVASGDAQLGMTAFTAGIFAIAGGGKMKIVAGGYEEAKGFKGLAILANNAAYEAGLRKPGDLKGRKVGSTQTGAPMEHQVVRVGKTHGYRFGDITFVRMQTLGNLVSALRGGQIDATALPATLAVGVEKSGGAKIIAWMADEVPGQLGGIFANANTMSQNRALVVRFLRAYIKSIRHYDAAFQQKGPDGTPGKGANYDETLTIIADYLGEPPAQVAAGLPYFNPDARLTAADIAEQIEVWHAMKLLDPAVTVGRVVDPSFLATAVQN